MSLVVRDRVPADVPELVTLLTEQQPASSYPIRWPLPFPVEDFLVRPGELRAWVAELDGAVVGHATASVLDEPLARLFAAGTGASEHEMVSVLFTGTTSRGLGAGGLLLDTVVAWIRERGRVPVLDVVPVHDTALAIYLRRGWVEVGRSRFAWLEEHLPDVLLLALPPYPSAPTSARSTSA